MAILFYDTCSLLLAQEKAFENKFYLSIITLKELENIKTSTYKDEETKYKARHLLHLLLENEDKYEVDTTDWHSKLSHLNLPDNNDSLIITSAYFLNKKQDIVFITNDLACRALASTMKIPTSFYEEANDEGYTGYLELILDEDEQAKFYADAYTDNKNIYNLLTNQYAILIDKTSNKIIDKYKWTGTEYMQVPYRKTESTFFGKTGPKDGDVYQHIALDTLLTNQISMLRGPAGSGKSYLAFSAMFDMLEHHKINKIIIFCNTVATKGSAKLGFYPGSRTEKLLDSQIGNFLESKLGGRDIVEDMIAKGIIVLLPMSDIRGYDTTGMNACIYITEAQNLDIELMRLALQRIGEDSYCILDGDSNAQVDLDMYAGGRNGMRRVSEVFRNNDFYGEVTLKTIKRSKIAELAQQL